MPLTSIAREELLALHKELGWSEYVFVNSKTFKPLTDDLSLLCVRLESKIFISTICATLARRGLVIVVPAPSRSLKSWDGQTFMAMRYTHATGDGIRRAMQLLTQTGVGNGKVVQFQNWTDTKVPTLNGNGQHALPVSA